MVRNWVFGHFVCPLAPNRSFHFLDCFLVSRIMRHFLLRDGMQIAYQQWGATTQASKRILAMHGRLDNSNTFKMLGPKLAATGYEFVAIDMIGHGKSSHLGAEGTYQSSPASVAVVNEVLEELGWDNANILGHSMGAGIGLMFAGTFPEKVNKLVMIEGMGPITAEPEATATNLRRTMEAERKYAIKVTSTPGGKSNVPRIYLTFTDAVAARIKSVSTYPGTQSLSVEAAQHLVGRGTYRVDADTGAALPLREGEVEDRDNVDGDGAVRFRHDPRLVIASSVYHTKQQIMAVVNAVSARSLLISAVEHGWPLGEDPAFDHLNRINCLTNKGLLTHKHLPGSHHLHLDPDTEPAVTREITTFLEQVQPHLGGKIEF